MSRRPFPPPVFWPSRAHPPPALLPACRAQALLWPSFARPRPPRSGGPVRLAILPRGWCFGPALHARAPHSGSATWPAERVTPTLLPGGLPRRRSSPGLAPPRSGSAARPAARVAVRLGHLGGRTWRRSDPPPCNGERRAPCGASSTRGRRRGGGKQGRGEEAVRAVREWREKVATEGTAGRGAAAGGGGENSREGAGAMKERRERMRGRRRR
ncbi:hypothetical protein C2845_PM08G07240 [Panicum miliaceum]|uniref:Uncharacterized protein n=1 Tax=Panicum miliaceum TaxID=4540 RepID=A0A3L6R163_PANMI|nr:hypothetical protein C2845_PM08G07240 [Panicum miliaceum]